MSQRKCSGRASKPENPADRSTAHERLRTAYDCLEANLDQSPSGHWGPRRMRERRESLPEQTFRLTLAYAGLPGLTLLELFGVGAVWQERNVGWRDGTPIDFAARRARRATLMPVRAPLPRRCGRDESQARQTH